MFRNVIVGVDGEEGGRDAIALAKMLSEKRGTLSLAYIYHGDPHVWRGTSPPYEATEMERTRHLLRRERERAEVDAHLHCRGSASIGRGLHELAEKLGADLIVIGSCRRGLIGRVLVGDDTHSALNGAPCAVAIAPAGFAHQPAIVREIGVGYDGSPESEQALMAARELARSHGARIRALSVVSLKNVRDEKPIPADWPEAAERLVDERLNRLSELPGIEGDAVYGGPREELSRFSGEVDLLIVGSRGYGPLGRLLHGSISRYLVRHAACPLLVLARGPVLAAAADTADRPRTSTALPV